MTILSKKGSQDYLKLRYIKLKYSSRSLISTNSYPEKLVPVRDQVVQLFFEMLLYKIVQLNMNSKKVNLLHQSNVILKKVKKMMKNLEFL